MARALRFVLGCFIGICLATSYSMPTFETALEYRIVEKYSTVELSCSAYGHGNINYTWYNTEKNEMSPNNKRFLIVDHSSSSSLFIQHVNVSDEGVYTCKAADEQGSASKLFNVSVTTPTEYLHIVQLEDVIAKEGRTVFITCEARGHPPPNLTISKIFKRYFQDVYNIYEDFKTDPRVNVTVMNEGEKTVLTLRISDVKRKDDAVYACRAQNHFAEVKKKCNLEVQFIPEVKAARSSLVVWQPETINLTCSASGMPIPYFNWLFNNETLPADPYTKFTHEFSSELTRSQLQILARNRSSEEIYGIYTCEAVNELGTNSTDIEVKEGKVPGQLLKIIFRSETPTAIILDFKDPIEDGLPITDYIVGYRINRRPNDPMQYVNWTKGSTYKVTNLKPSTLYSLKAAAINADGVGLWKSMQYVTLPGNVPDPPMIITEPEDVSSFSDRFTIKWLLANDNGWRVLYFYLRFFQVKKINSKWMQVDELREEEIHSWNELPSFELTGLSPSSYYKVSIAAVNENGFSPYASVIIRTRGDDPPVTRQPTIAVEETSLVPWDIVGVVIGLCIILFIVDILSFYVCRCGLLSTTNQLLRKKR